MKSKHTILPVIFLIIFSLTVNVSELFAYQSTGLSPAEDSRSVTSDTESMGPLSYVGVDGIKTFKVKKSNLAADEESRKKIADTATVVRARVEVKAQTNEKREMLARQVAPVQFAVMSEKFEQVKQEITGYQEDEEGNLLKVILDQELKMVVAMQTSKEQPKMAETFINNAELSVEAYERSALLRKDEILVELQYYKTIYELAGKAINELVAAEDSSEKSKEKRVEESIDKFLKVLDDAVKSVREFYLPEADRGVLSVSEEARKAMRKYRKELFEVSKVQSLASAQLKLYFLDLAMTNYEDIYEDMEKVDWENEQSLEDNKSLLGRFLDFYRMRHPWVNILLGGQYATKAEMEYLSDIIEKLYNKSADEENSEKGRSTQGKVDTVMLYRLLMPILATVQANNNKDFWYGFTFGPEELEKLNEAPRKRFV